MGPAELSWLWMPITIGAAFAQTLRNAAQRHLTGGLGALGATLVRFLYGLPFAVLWLAVAWVGFARAGAWPAINAAFLVWTVVAALSQIAATALLLRNMEERNFAIGVAYSKSEIIQVAIFGLVLLGDRVSAIAVVSIVIASVAVMLLSLPQGDRSLAAVALGDARTGVGRGVWHGCGRVSRRGPGAGDALGGVRCGGKPGLGTDIPDRAARRLSRLAAMARHRRGRARVARVAAGWGDGRDRLGLLVYCDGDAAGRAGPHAGPDRTLFQL